MKINISFHVNNFVSTICYGVNSQQQLVFRLNICT